MNNSQQLNFNFYSDQFRYVFIYKTTKHVFVNIRDSQLTYLWLFVLYSLLNVCEFFTWF